MSIRTQLLGLARVIADECEHNAPFRANVESCLGSNERKNSKSKLATAEKKTRPHRRAPALLDPLDLARQGLPFLREQLEKLEIEQLKDIVAEFGMDPSKLVMKWREIGRIVDHIAETSMSRASKGAAFRQ